MNSPSFVHREKHWPIAAGRALLNVVIAYDGIAAAKVVHASTWGFKFLDNSELRIKAAAAEADLLVLAANLGAVLPGSVKAWLRTCLPRNRRSEFTVVALLGEGDCQNRLDSPYFQFVQRIAREAGACFLAPFAKPEGR